MRGLSQNSRTGGVSRADAGDRRRFQGSWRVSQRQHRTCDLQRRHSQKTQLKLRNHPQSFCVVFAHLGKIRSVLCGVAHRGRAFRCSGGGRVHDIGVAREGALGPRSGEAQLARASLLIRCAHLRSLFVYQAQLPGRPHIYFAPSPSWLLSSTTSPVTDDSCPSISLSPS